MFSATQLACSRGGRLLFEGVNFTLNAGAGLHITGANGAGKTTLLRTLVGLCAPDAGGVGWQGQPIEKNAAAFRREMIYLGHQAGVKDELTPLENLLQSAELEGCPVSIGQAVAALKHMGLQRHSRLPTRCLSAGQKRRVLLARLQLRPVALWVLDEPLAALDAAGVQQMGQLLNTHLGRGGMVVLTSHQPIALATVEVLAL
jgi:heme exporter protein A